MKSSVSCQISCPLSFICCASRTVTVAVRTVTVAVRTVSVAVRTVSVAVRTVQTSLQCFSSVRRVTSLFQQNRIKKHLTTSQHQRFYS